MKEKQQTEFDVTGTISMQVSLCVRAENENDSVMKAKAELMDDHNIGVAKFPIGRDNVVYKLKSIPKNHQKMSTENQKVTDLTPKTIKDKSQFKLTNADISANYLNEKFHLMINDFKGAFACWATRQNPNETYGVIADATQAYTKFLQQRYFKTKDTVVEMDCDLIKKLTDEDLFVAIPEILALNEMKPNFIDLGALSRNVFYHILREQITQPL